jgi:hypothetical protein
MKFCKENRADEIERSLFSIRYERKSDSATLNEIIPDEFIANSKKIETLANAFRQTT